MTSKLEVKGLCRSFGNFKALDHVSFALPAGAVYGFVGPNGAGKTTCLRILAGIDDADAGSILIDGKDLTCYPEILRKRTGLMPDTLPDLSDMTTWEYLDFVGRAFGKNAEQRKKRYGASLYPDRCGTDAGSETQHAFQRDEAAGLPRPDPAF